jgi:hypothetical protein
MAEAILRTESTWHITILWLGKRLSIDVTIITKPDLSYLKEAEAKGSGKPKGDINIADILPGSMGVKVNEDKNIIDIQIDTRTFSLRADSLQTAQDWARAIRAWIAFVNGD